MKLKWIYCLPILWYSLGHLPKDDLRKVSYQSGLWVSQKYKKYPAWDRCIEPIIIRQLSVIDCISHSFVKGMISDNEKTLFEELTKELKNEIKEELNDLEN